MQVISLQELVPTEDHPLWWMVGRPYYSTDTLDCFVRPYDFFSKIPSDIRGAGGGLERYAKIMRELKSKYVRDYQAQVKTYKRQYRFVISGPNSICVQATTRCCVPTDGGFTSSEPGAALEQLSLLASQSFQWTEGSPSNVGILLAHAETKPGYVSVWLAHEWRARKGNKFIECEKCALLGEIKYTTTRGDGREPTGETPIL